MKKAPFIVAIDGPSGSGKSTIAQRASKQLNWGYLSTGMLYRFVGYVALLNNVDLDDVAALEQLIAQCTPEFTWDVQTQHFFFKNKDISEDLLGERMGRLASDVGKLPEVRKLLLPLQRNVVRQAHTGVLIDGRDIGTVVFPEAPVKIFMTASLEARAERRLNQLKEQKQDKLPSLADLVEILRQRDFQDSNRDAAPLMQAKDAHFLDTSRLSIDACVAQVVAWVTQALREQP